MPLKVSNAKRLLTGPFFSPPDPPAPQRLSKTRKEMILAFKAKPGIHENKGSEEWEHRLFCYLNRKDPKIQTWDVRKWVKVHDWITDRVPAPKISEVEDDEEAEDAIPVHLEKGEPVVIKQEIEEAAATGPLHRAAKPTRKLRHNTAFVNEEGDGENKEVGAPKAATRSRDRPGSSNRDGERVTRGALVDQNMNYVSKPKNS